MSDPPPSTGLRVLLALLLLAFVGVQGPAPLGETRGDHDSDPCAVRASVARSVSPRALPDFWCGPAEPVPAPDPARPEPVPPRAVLPAPPSRPPAAPALLGVYPRGPPPPVRPVRGR